MMSAMAAKSVGRRRVQSYLPQAEYTELQELYGSALRAGRTQARSADSWVSEWLLEASRARAAGSPSEAEGLPPELLRDVEATLPELGMTDPWQLVLLATKDFCERVTRFGGSAALRAGWDVPASRVAENEGPSYTSGSPSGAKSEQGKRQR